MRMRRTLGLTSSLMYKNRKPKSCLCTIRTPADRYIRTTALEEKPIKSLDAHANGENGSLSIPRRQKSVAGTPAGANGSGDTNGVQKTAADPSSGKRKLGDVSEPESSTKKRSAVDSIEDGGPATKRSKVVGNGGPPTDDDLIVVDDAGDGAIVIDDD
jgi:hypothetical protein